MSHDATYSACLATSQRIAWTIDQVLGGRQLNFGQDFLPESLAGSKALDFLNAKEQRTHNHVRAHGYLATFGLVEEFILPFIVDHSKEGEEAHSAADQERQAALNNFAEEEAKHIELFKRFSTLFETGFGSACDCIGPPEAIAEHVLAQDQLGVALMILHIEWMTLDHYVASVRDEAQLDPMFRDLLRYHWLEESQHARMDWLVVQELAEGLSHEEINTGFQSYLELLQFFDGGMRGQAGLDLATLKERLSRSWTELEEQRYLEQQHASLRVTFVDSGALNRTFQQLLETLRPGSARELTAFVAQLGEAQTLAA